MVKLRDKICKVKSELIIPYDKNNKKHPEAQINLLVENIKRFGFTNPLLIDENNIIIAGHGRYEAGLKLGFNEFPCIKVDDLTESEKRALRISDNRVGELAEIDWDNLKEEWLNIKEQDKTLEYLTGYNEEELSFLDDEDGSSNPDENTYTKKIDVPMYEQQGEQPPLEDLYDTEKYDRLIKLIEESSVSDNIKEFLKLTATRHIKFDYANIAEYYTHTDKETQELMEKLALVIIDFEKAIEEGYIKLREEIISQYLDEYEKEE